MLNFSKASGALIDIVFACKYDADVEMKLEDYVDTDRFDDSTFYELFKNENFLKAAKLWLPFFHKRGFLDVSDLGDEGKGKLEDVKENSE